MRWWRVRLLVSCCVLACACAARTGGGAGGSLRGALEALQRRQRARAERPHAPQRYPDAQDYEEALYELYGPPPLPQYDEDQYGIDLDAIEEAIPEKYIVKYLNEDEPPRKSYYDYNLKKKKSHPEPESTVARKAKQSAFRERALNHNADDRLKELFMDRVGENEKKKEKAEEQFENDAEYAVLLEKLWSKYKSNHPNFVEASPEGVVKLYKEMTVKKRQYPNEVSPWGPVAFKRKRSPVEDDDVVDTEDYSTALEYPLRPDDRLKYANDNDIAEGDPGYNQYEFPSDSDKDMRDEYAIAFQPVDDEKINLPTDGDEFSYDAIEKRFPVTKRSSGPYESMSQRKRSTDSKHSTDKRFRGGSGTDPKVVRELSKIFGEPGEIFKSPVKRSNNEENSHETKPPVISASPHNASQDQNMTHIHSDGSHEHHGHTVMHPPNLSGKEEIIETSHTSKEKDHPITLKKKSIDWSQYFGIDKRKKKSIPFRNDISEGLRRKYLETFNREMETPLMNSRAHNKVKRDFVINKPLDESEFVIDRASAIAIRSEEKRNVDQQDDSKLDNIDRKLKGVETVIVDEALHLSNIGGESKDEQDVKEKMLSRLAAAYSLEKMRKALKEFKQSLHAQKGFAKPSVDFDESKTKRIAVKKEKAEIKHEDVQSSKATEFEGEVNDDFEGEQGAGHYSNGGTDESFSEGYMGGSGRQQAPASYQGPTGGSCPVLERIVRRCRGIELLAGDPGQLFLPLCSLHQICYLCGQSPPTTCDLIFLSEADTSCGGDAECQQAARATLMAVRELHDALADELDGECQAQPCLASALRRQHPWTQVLRR